jgi:DNA-binding Xre family transcriptional regulator
MISYAPLMRLIEERKVSTYALQYKGSISSSTIRNIKQGRFVSTATVDALCKLFDCRVEEIIEYIPDES